MYIIIISISISVINKGKGIILALDFTIELHYLFLHYCY